VEHQTPPLPDHVVMLYLNQPRDVDCAMDSRMRRIAAQTDDVLIGPSGATTAWLQPYGDGDTFHFHISPERFSALLGGDEVKGRGLELIPKIFVKDDVLARLLRQCGTELRDPGLASTTLLESFALAIAVLTCPVSSDHF
jgi:hypothetical protein